MSDEGQAAKIHHAGGGAARDQQQTQAGHREEESLTPARAEGAAEAALDAAELAGGESDERPSLAQELHGLALAIRLVFLIVIQHGEFSGCPSSRSLGRHG